MTHPRPPALIVGGGIIGLTSAFRLARAGHPVTLFDPSLARGATWAAAGMVAPSGEIAPGEESNYQLQKTAIDAWIELSADLAGVTGDQVAVHRTDTLIAGWDASDRRLVEQFVEVAATFDAPLRRVSRVDAPEIFAELSARITDGVVMSGDAWLDPDQAVAALRRALDVQKVAIVSERVAAIGVDGPEVVARTEHDEYRAALGVIATGTWPLPEGAVPSGRNVIRPVRGITVRAQGPDRSDQPMIRAFVRGRVVYMLSRPGGYCVLGATSEERAEPGVEIGELQRVLRDALDVVPALEVASVLEIRHGLRPTSADLRPFFEILGDGRWAWSSGHYRHGIALAPLAARAAAEFADALS
jgi:glycine oxidase